MSATVVLLILAGLFLVLIIFWAGFRGWIYRQLRAIGLLIGHYAPRLWTWLVAAFHRVMRILNIYIRIVFWCLVGALVLTTLAIIIKVPWFTGVAFVVSIIAIIVAWLPAGLVLRLFRVNSAVVPPSLRVMIAWIAFVGFLGMVAPQVMTFTVAMGAILVAFILMGAASKFSLLERLVIPVVIIMCCVLAWKYFFPDGYRSTVRYASSWGKRFNTAKDRGSINNEADAATTYAFLLDSVSVLYRASDSTLSDISEVAVNLPKGAKVKVANHKKEVAIYDGQGFTRIQLPKANGSFVNGPKYWIEAELLDLASPSETVRKAKEPETAVAPQPQPNPNPGAYEVLLPDSTYTYQLAPRQTTGWKQIPGDCTYFPECTCLVTMPTFVVYYDDGDLVDFTDGRYKELPIKTEPVFQVSSRCDEPMTLTIRVARRNVI